MYIETAKVLKGSDRRVFMARIVRSFGYGGQSLAARELGWCGMCQVFETTLDKKLLSIVRR
jgi:hypothetical protein